MFEMAGLAVTHAARGQGVRRYDAFVSDPEGDTAFAELRCDGDIRLSWRLQDGVIVAPECFAGIFISLA